MSLEMFPTLSLAQLSERQKSQDCQEKYNDLLEEWRKQTTNSSVEWMHQLNDRLGGRSHADDFLDWLKEQIRPNRPGTIPYDSVRLLPKDFAKKLKLANWEVGDRASDLVTGRLWYGNVSPEPEFILGWAHPQEGWHHEGLIGLRLNAHDLNLEETDPSVLGDHPIETLLPHIFFGMRYTPITNQGSAVDKCFLLLGNLFILRSQKISPTRGRYKSAKWEKTTSLLALELNSPGRNYVVLPDPVEVADTSAGSLRVGELRVKEAGQDSGNHSLIKTLTKDCIFRHNSPQSEGYPYELDVKSCIFDLEFEQLSLEEPELGEIGVSGMSTHFVALFPPRAVLASPAQSL
ncbi:hypothetical protein EJ08DRAFT_677469 [Tothia fuscella]|uniref:Uncharacterized protein n=1 Tax=Tothia fuscella TaxID=1048955 RepID=A0A9P4NUM9_9PEZI|nr:hypothetical protein EJ08DRAFT_677469 [Tothia fuscella]